MRQAAGMHVQVEFYRQESFADRRLQLIQVGGMVPCHE